MLQRRGAVRIIHWFSIEEPTRNRETDWQTPAIWLVPHGHMSTRMRLPINPIIPAKTTTTAGATYLSMVARPQTAWDIPVISVFWNTGVTASFVKAVSTPINPNAKDFSTKTTANKKVCDMLGPYVHGSTTIAKLPAALWGLLKINITLSNTTSINTKSIRSMPMLPWTT